MRWWKGRVRESRFSSLNILSSNNQRFDSKMHNDTHHTLEIDDNLRFKFVISRCE